MTLTERIQLIRAGYNKREIQEIIDAEAKPAEPEPAPASPAPVQEPAPVENPVTNVDNSEAILAAIQELRGAIQSSNIRKDQMPEAPERTGADVLKNLINGGK